MFSVAMNKAVDEAQHILDLCCKSENVALVATEDINQFTELWNKISPLKINFENKGIFNKIKINKYWDRFEEIYPILMQVVDKFSKHEKVITNTITTLNNANIKFLDEYNEFINKGNIDDVDYIQQKLVTDNIKLLLENTIQEYIKLRDKIKMLEIITLQSLDTAIVLAKTQNRVISKVNVTSNRDFKKDYMRVKTVIG